MIPMLDNIDLTFFLTMARTLNFTKASQELFVSQQAVSQRISKLEQNLGFPLFVRSRNYVKLTRAGERLYAFLEPVEREYLEVLAECRTDYERISRTLRIGYQNMLNWNDILDSATDAFTEQNPNVQIIGELHDTYVLTDKLKSGQLHMVICYERFVPNTEGFERLVILETPIFLMVSTKKKRPGNDTTYLDYKNEPWIEDIFGDEPTENCLKRAKKTAAFCGLTPSDYILVPNRDTANMAAESGRGIIVGTQYGVAYKSQGVLIYPTNAKEHIVCLWNTGEENMMVQRYAAFLQKAHSR